VYLLLN